MQPILTFLAGLGPWNWFILALVLFTLETILPGVHFLWFGVAAVVTGILALTTGVGLSWQMIAFAVLAAATVFIVRRYARPDMARSDEPDLNVRGAQYIGRTVTVEEPISAGRGKARVGDTVWVVQGPDAAKGASVKITGVDGTVLVVERVQQA